MSFFLFLFNWHSSQEFSFTTKQLQSDWIVEWYDTNEFVYFLNNSHAHWTNNFHHFINHLLTILPWKNLHFTSSVQQLIEIQGWLLLTIFICLHNQLSSFNSIIVQMSEKCDSSIDIKNEWLLLSCENQWKFPRFSYFNFETNFLENENLFQETGAPFLSWNH